MPFHDTVVLAAFLTAVATLILFGATLPFLIRRLDLPTRSFKDKTEEVGALLGDLCDAVTDRLGPLDAQEVDGKRITPEAANMVVKRLGPMLLTKRYEVLADQPEAGDMSLQVQRRYHRAFRDALAREQSIGAYSTESMEYVASVLDADEQRLYR